MPRPVRGRLRSTLVVGTSMQVGKGKDTHGMLNTLPTGTAICAHTHTRMFRGVFSKINEGTMTQLQQPGSSLLTLVPHAAAHCHTRVLRRDFHLFSVARWRPPQSAREKRRDSVPTLHIYGKGVTGHLALIYITAGIWSTIVRRVRASILQEGGRRASETSLSILDVE